MLVTLVLGLAPRSTANYRTVYVCNREILQWTIGKRDRIQTLRVQFKQL